MTGTNGKSTTTTWIWAALQRHAPPAAAITTVEWRLGGDAGPAIRGHREFLSVARQLHERGGDLLALELTSASLGMGFMSAWPVEVGVFTNLSQDHDEQHGSPEHYLASKAQLFVHLPPGGVAVLNASDPSAALLAEVLPEGVELRTYAAPWRGPAVLPVDLELELQEITVEGTRGRLRGPLAHETGAELHVSASGAHFLENAAAAILGARAMGVPARLALQAIAAHSAPSGRFERVHERPLVVVDYAHTPDALRRTLEAARALVDGELWVVFGAGGRRSRSKRRPLGEAAYSAEHVVLTNDNPRDEDPAAIVAQIREGLEDHPDTRIELDRERAIEDAVTRARPEDVVVVAGKGHERDQEVGDTRRVFSDADIIRRAIAARS